MCTNFACDNTERHAFFVKRCHDLCRAVMYECSKWELLFIQKNPRELQSSKNLPQTLQPAITASLELYKKS